MPECVHHTTVFNGACSNCQWSSQSNTCTLRSRTKKNDREELETAKGRGRQAGSVSDDGSSMVVEMVRGLTDENLVELHRTVLDELEARNIDTLSE